MVFNLNFHIQVFFISTATLCEIPTLDRSMPDTSTRVLKSLSHAHTVSEWESGLPSAPPAPLVSWAFHELPWTPGASSGPRWPGTQPGPPCTVPILHPIKVTPLVSWSWEAFYEIIPTEVWLPNNITCTTNAHMLNKRLKEKHFTPNPLMVEF